MIDPPLLTYIHINIVFVVIVTENVFVLQGLAVGIFHNSHYSGNGSVSACVDKHSKCTHAAECFPLNSDIFFIYSIHAILSNQSELHPFQIAWQLLA